MKVTTDTPELLIVDDKPVLIGLMLILFILIFVGVGLALVFSGEWLGLLFGLMGGGLGLGAFYVFVRRVQLVLDRPGGWMELRRKNLFGGSVTRYALADLDGADVEQSSTSDGGATARVVLLLSGPHAGRTPLTLAFSSSNRHYEIAAKLNAWLDKARAAGGANARQDPAAADAPAGR